MTEHPIGNNFVLIPLQGGPRAGYLGPFFARKSAFHDATPIKNPFFGPRGPLVLSLVGPPARKKFLRCFLFCLLKLSRILIQDWPHFVKTTSHCLQTEHRQTVGNRAADQVHSMVTWWKQNLTDKNGVRSFCFTQTGGKMVWENRTWEDVRRSTFLEIPETQRITPGHCEYLSKCITATKG